MESEDLHRRAYNAAFMHFDVRSPRDGRVVQWSEEFYNALQNKIGGGKPKMRWFFGTALIRDFGFKTSFYMYA